MLSNGVELAKEIWEDPALLFSHRTSMGVNNLTSFCGKTVHAEKQQSRAVMEGGQALGFFFPKSVIVFGRGRRAALCLRVFQKPSAVA